jgi:hypothetical protein
MFQTSNQGRPNLDHLQWTTRIAIRPTHCRLSRAPELRSRSSGQFMCGPVVGGGAQQVLGWIHGVAPDPGHPLFKNAYLAMTTLLRQPRGSSELGH